MDKDLIRMIAWIIGTLIITLTVPMIIVGLTSIGVSFLVISLTLLFYISIIYIVLRIFFDD